MSKEKSPWILNQILPKETPICRYMGFDVFLQILSGKFFVPRKMRFLDARESGKISMKYRFAFGSANENDKEQIDTLDEDRQCQINQYIENLIQSKYLLTSCWTIDNGEDYLMWKSYTTDIGVCVRTTINDLLESIDYEKESYVPICSPMIYGNVSIQKEFLESVFTKDKYYISEKEIRIYFVPKSNLNNVDLNMITNSDVEEILFNASCLEEELYKSDTYSCTLHKFFDIHPSFIKSIIFSPRIKSGTFSCFRYLLRNQYPNIFTSDYMITESKINIKS